ncbi:MAG: hydrogenase maturation protease [Nitrospinaceae bacterium]
MNPPGAIRVIGIGNDFRKDDAAGLLTARILKERFPDSVTVAEQNGEAAALMESWRGADRAILIDAAHSGDSPGTVRRFDAVKEPLPSGIFRCSSHQFGVTECVELARALGRLPGSLVIYGIEGKDFGDGTGVSKEVENGIREAVDRVVEEVRGVSGAGSGESSRGNGI